MQRQLSEDNMDIKNYINNILQDQRKKGLIQIIGSGALITIILLFLFIFLPYIFSNRDPYDKYDSTSGRYINTYKGTSTGWENFVDITFLEKIQQAGMQIDSYDKLQTILEYFFTYSYPNIKSLAIKKKSLKKDNENYLFTLSSNTGQEFQVNTKPQSNDKISIEITSNNNKIYTYDASFYQKFYDNKNLIDKMLPKNLTLSNGTQFTVVKNYLGNYEISIQSCGDTTLNDEALKLTNNWLESVNLNQSDFTFNIPKKCDGDNAHHTHRYYH